MIFGSHNVMSEFNEVGKSDLFLRKYSKKFIGWKVLAYQLISEHVIEVSTGQVFTDTSFKITE